jgi:hypothetical protein
MVDDDDYEELNQYKWSLSQNGYVTRAMQVEGKFIRFLMHRLVNKTTEKLVTDHINRNKLDNRKSNLRSVTYAVNRLNTGLNSNNVSGLKRLSWNDTHKVWAIKIVKETKLERHVVYNKTFKNWNEAVDALLAAEKIHLDPEFWQQRPAQNLTQPELQLS